eukprot:scaffold7136_cov20-Tisochrysis_lutea.AAC.1
MAQYEGGWKKKLKYVLAICPTSVVDVTARYTRQYAVVSQRRAVPDSWLQAQAQTVTQQLRASLPPGVLRALELRDVSEQLVGMQAPQQGMQGCRRYNILARHARVAPYEGMQGCRWGTLLIGCACMLMLRC